MIYIVIDVLCERYDVCAEGARIWTPANHRHCVMILTLDHAIDFSHAKPHIFDSTSH